MYISFLEKMIRDGVSPHIEQAKHCIGMDEKKTYKRHGTRYYRPFRNYFNTSSDDPVWTYLVELGYAEEYRPEFFRLTKKGMEWLGVLLKVKIKEDRRCEKGNNPEEDVEG